MSRAKREPATPAPDTEPASSVDFQGGESLLPNLDGSRGTDEGEAPDDEPRGDERSGTRTWAVRMAEIDERIALLQAQRRRLEHLDIAERCSKVKHLRHFARMIRACWRSGLFAAKAQTYVDEALPLLASYERPATGPDLYIVALQQYVEHRDMVAIATGAALDSLVPALKRTEGEPDDTYRKRLQALPGPHPDGTTYVPPGSAGAES